MMDKYTLLQKIGIYASIVVFITFMLLPFVEMFQHPTSESNAMVLLLALVQLFLAFLAILGLLLLAHYPAAECLFCHHLMVELLPHLATNH